MCSLCWPQLTIAITLGRGARGTGRHTRKGTAPFSSMFVSWNSFMLFGVAFIGGFIVTKYRIPEIVVPNLDGFEVSELWQWVISYLSLSLSLSLSLPPSLPPSPSQLKPYVSYKTPYVSAKPITAEDILSIVQPYETVDDNTTVST